MNQHIYEDLKLLEGAVAYQRWLYSFIEPYLGRRILEVGSGIGIYTKKFLNRDLIVATDNDDNYVTYLKKYFAEYSQVQVRPLDAAAITADEQEGFIRQGIDTVVLSNVLEHLPDDLSSLAALRDCLKQDGRLIIIVPALQSLYGSLDEAYGHYRRYNRGDFIRFQSGLGMSLDFFRYFNLPGIMGWYFSAKLQKRKNLSFRQAMLFDKIVPFEAFLEKHINLPVGLSIAAVFKKSGLYAKG